MTKSPQKRKVTAAYLERAALHYLGRFSATEEKLRTVLGRKVMRRNEDNAPASEEQLGWIEAVVKKCVEYGYVNDESYARQRAAALVRKGKAPYMISQDLRQNGVDSDLAVRVLALLAGESDDDLALRAAASLVRRRRFGPFRRADSAKENVDRKELAALMRAGFSYSVAQAVLAMDEDTIIGLLP